MPDQIRHIKCGSSAFVLLALLGFLDMTHQPPLTINLPLGQLIPSPLKWIITRSELQPNR